MASTIVTKNSSTASAVPVTGDLTQGELAVNVTDKKLYTKDSGGTVVKLVGGLGNQEANAVAITGGSINGTTVGATTASTGAFTTLSASSTVSGTGFSTYLSSPPAIGGTAAAAGSFTTLSASSTTTLSGGTANGVAYLNGSKVVTTGSALVFDGSTIKTSGAEPLRMNNDAAFISGYNTAGTTRSGYLQFNASDVSVLATSVNQPFAFFINASEQMRLTSTGLGIGTSSPAAKLHSSKADGGYVFAVSGTTKGMRVSTDANQTLLQGVDNTLTGSYQPLTLGGSILLFQTNGTTEAMRLDSSGNLGLGVTPSAWSGLKAFEIAGVGSSLASASNNNLFLSSNAWYNGTNWRYGTSAEATQYQSFAGAHKWYNAPSGTAGNAITFTQAMTLDASGNLLVGATTSYGLLTLGGTSSSTAKLAQLTSRTTFDIVPGNTDASGVTLDVGWVSGGQGPMKFATSGTERARIDSSGNLLIGTTSAANTALGFRVIASATVPQVSVGVSATSNNYVLYNTTAAAFRFYVSDAGQINATSTSITAISDSSLKENVRDLETGLNEVMALKPRRFDWKEETKLGLTNVAGFIAQEVEQVLPELVSDYQYSEGVTKKSLKMGDILPTLVKAIQELKAEFDAYKATHP